MGFELRVSDLKYKLSQLEINPIRPDWQLYIKHVYYNIHIYILSAKSKPMFLCARPSKGLKMFL